MSVPSTQPWRLGDCVLQWATPLGVCIWGAEPVEPSANPEQEIELVTPTGSFLAPLSGSRGGEGQAFRKQRGDTSGGSGGLGAALLSVHMFIRLTNVAERILIVAKRCKLRVIWLTLHSLLLTRSLRPLHQVLAKAWALLCNNQISVRYNRKAIEHV